MDKRKKIQIWVTIICLISVLLILFLAGYKYGKSKVVKEVVYIDFSVNQNKENVEEKGYFDFIDKELSDYICNMCKELEIDPYMAVAILMRENPTFNPDAIHRNDNGTLDLGLWQMNNAYIYTTFIPAYWIEGIEFNPFNWKQNTYLALHHIKYLQEKVKVMDDVICAYNCGAANVFNHTIPDSTVNYLATVKINMKLLKERY